MISPTSLTEREDALFRKLLADRDDRTFNGVLYRDGVPRPDVYLAQQIRVVFAFREPNLRNNPYEIDMREQIRDSLFRAKRQGTYRPPGTLGGWWNRRVAALGHAVLHALQGVPGPSALRAFHQVIAGKQRTHEFLFPFGFIQIKKVGGGPQSDGREIERFAKTYAHVLNEQIRIYQPNLVIGCGLSGGSPARLLNRYVLGSEATEQRTGRFAWWRYPDSAHPVALLEFHHPSSRGARDSIYRELWSAVNHMKRRTGL